MNEDFSREDKECALALYSAALDALQAVQHSLPCRHFTNDYQMIQLENAIAFLEEKVEVLQSED